MTVRDLKPQQLRRLANESDQEFEAWFKRTRGLEFGTNKPLETIDIWRAAFSKGASTILKRVDAIKEDV
jgi:hypothetical protein